MRWSIEPANAVGKQQVEIGQARNRVRNAVARTVPFGMLVQSLVVIWYALHGYHPDDVSARRVAQPWYQTKSEPSFEDMITKQMRACGLPSRDRADGVAYAFAHVDIPVVDVESHQGESITGDLMQKAW